jgi:hypothetical protein
MKPTDEQIALLMRAGYTATDWSWERVYAPEKGHNVPVEDALRWVAKDVDAAICRAARHNGTAGAENLSQAIIIVRKQVAP